MPVRRPDFATINARSQTFIPSGETHAPLLIGHRHPMMPMTMQRLSGSDTDRMLLTEYSLMSP